MPFGLASRKRVKGLAATVAAMGERLDEVAARLDRLAVGIDRRSSDLGEVNRRLDGYDADRRDGADRVTELRDEVATLQRRHDDASGLIADLQAAGRTGNDSLADLRERHDTAAGEIADHRSRLDRVEETGERQERTLDQVRADVMRIERQAKVDLAELRTTDTALARMVLKADGVRGSAAT